MPGLIQKIGDWFEQRLKLAPFVRATMEHPVPTKSASWFYVFGSAALTVFIMQIFTGIMLALIYVPSAGRSLEQPAVPQSRRHAGMVPARRTWLGLELHGRHRAHPHGQVVLFGAYKFPRELTWIVGVFLLLMTLGMAFTGQVLRFDQDAYWGLGYRCFHLRESTVHRGVGGPPVARGPIIAGAYAVAVLRAARIRDSGPADRFVSLHLLMVLKLGINEWPMPGRLVRRSTYVQEYHELAHKRRHAVRAGRGVEGHDLLPPPSSSA